MMRQDTLLNAPAATSQQAEVVPGNTNLPRDIRFHVKAPVD